MRRRIENPRHGLSRLVFLQRWRTYLSYRLLPSMPLSYCFPPAGSWPDIEPPSAPRRPHQIVQLGRMRIDNYAWMKFIPDTGSRSLESLPTQLRAHLKAEMRYAQQMLGPLERDAEDLYERMMKRAATVSEPLMAPEAGWLYRSTRSEAHGWQVFYRINVEGVREQLLDEGQRAGGCAYYRATGHQASPDDRYFAWAEDVRGDDRHRLCIMDTETAEIRTLVEDDAFGYGGLTFSPSSRYVFWIWRDAYSRPARLYRSPVDGGDPTLIYEEKDPAIFMQVTRTAAGGYVVLSLVGPDVSEVHLITARDEEGPLRIVRPRHRGVRYDVDEWNDSLLMLTNADGAENRKLQVLDPITFSVKQERVGHRPGVAIAGVQPFAQALLRLERADGLHRLIVTNLAGRETVIRFDEPAYTIDLVPGQSYQSKRVLFVHQSPVTPPRWMAVDLAEATCHEVASDLLNDFDASRYRLERLFATASDGETIPITVLSPVNANASDPMPLLLTGYGAYGVASEPRFSLPATVLVESGFRYAIAHVRGGSEKGWRWYRDGCREKKRNSMTDFIACAHHLIDKGYTSPGRIVAHGVSAGGLLVCGAMNMAPELWAGVIAEVPFVDMLNTMSDADHPLVPLLRPDWGDPLADPQAYDSISGISPYENVKARAYPPLVCTAGLKDDRVPYWEPAKLVAQIRYLSTSSNPAILSLNPESGHQSADDQDAEHRQVALLWAFARNCVAGSS